MIKEQQYIKVNGQDEEKAKKFIDNIEAKQSIKNQQQKQQLIVDIETIDYQHQMDLNENQHLRKNTSIKYNCCDRLLCALVLVLLILAIICHFYVQRQLKAYKQRVERQQDKSKWNTIYTTVFFRKQNQQKLKSIAKSLSTTVKFKHQSQDELIQQINQLKQLKCKQASQQLFSIKKFNNKLQTNPKNKQKKQDIALKQLTQQTLISQQQQKKQKQQQHQVQKINEQQMKKHPDPIKPVAGITAQKIQNAKQFKTLIQLPLFQQNQISRKQYQYYQQNYKIGQYENQLPFCIVVPTFNNQQNSRYRQNIDSIVQQNYTNYHVVVIQDASTDQTGVLIDKHVQYLKGQFRKLGKQLKIDVYHNKQQTRALPNLRKAALEYCKAEQIYMIVDGDDRLIGRQVLKLFNSQFQEKNSWFVYSNFMSFTGTIGFSRPFKAEVMQDNRYRQSNFVTSHLRAFYTQLFRLIKQQDLKNDDRQYLRAANDVAICIPILQMCHTRVTYIPQVTYMYNSNTGYNNHLVRLRQQINNSNLIRKRKKYQALQSLKFD